jgi:hypothetical protein
MPWPRNRRARAPEAAGAAERFAVAIGLVERARSILLLAVPSGRAPRVALAEALAGFELELATAADAMESWRGPEAEDEWQACSQALLEASRRAERLRLEGNPEGYEALAPVLEELLEPLSAFDLAARRFQDGAG